MRKNGEEFGPREQYYYEMERAFARRCREAALEDRKLLTQPGNERFVNGSVMNQHGFSPSRSARAMRGQSDKVVAIIVTRLDSLSENLAVQTMLPAFYEQGYDPIMMESQFSPQLVAEHLGVLKRRNIDGGGAQSRPQQSAPAAPSNEPPMDFDDDIPF